MCLQGCSRGELEVAAVEKDDKIAQLTCNLEFGAQLHSYLQQLLQVHR